MNRVIFGVTEGGESAESELQGFGEISMGSFRQLFQGCYLKRPCFCQK